MFCSIKRFLSGPPEDLHQYLCVSMLCVWVFVHAQMGFSGTACEDCGPGRFGPSCDLGEVAPPKLTSHHLLLGSFLNLLWFCYGSGPECSCVHGVCDAGMSGSGHCTCFSGYKGQNCDQGQSVASSHHLNSLNLLCACLSPESTSFPLNPSSVTNLLELSSCF